MLSLCGLALLACVLSCEHHFFKLTGSLASDGGAYGRWMSRPIGCSRAPVEGPPLGAETIVTLLWDDHLERDHFAQTHTPRIGDKPGRLELFRQGPVVSGRLEMQKPTGAVLLDAQSCSKLSVATHEGKPMMEGGRPTLEGTVSLDCAAQGSHIEGELQFAGCEY